MQQESNISGKGSTYDYLRRDKLGDTGKEFYVAAAQEVEDAPAAVVMIQQRRTNRQDSLHVPLMGDEFRKLRDEEDARR